MKRPVSFLSLFLLFLLTGVTASSQVQLAFSGTPTVSGTAGAVNTTYTFNNIGTANATAIKGVIRITAISGTASLYTIDAGSGGSANAWQPVINGATTSNGNCWGMTFQISFFEQATNNPVTLSSFRANGIDIDGDGGNLREYNEPYNMSSYTVENPTSLTVTPTANGGVNFRSPQSGYNGISLTQTNVAATWYYTNTHAMTIKIGACCSGGSCSATGSTSRQYSINFYDAVAYNVGNTILPVDFTAISGAPVANGNKITWTVARESGLKAYEVEKSADAGTGFITIGVLPADDLNAETKQYSFIDTEAQGMAYYRIKGVDIDGRYKISPTIRLASVEKGNSIRFFNPPGSSTVDFELNSDRPGDIYISLSDQNGRVVYQGNKKAQQGTNRISIHHNVSFSQGIYQVNIIRDDGQRYSARFLK